MKKIAIIHDSFTIFGGAERVLFEMISLYPKADIFTSLITPEFKQQILSTTHGKLSFSKLSYLPYISRFASLSKPYFFHYYWQQLNLDQYDLVISSSHSFCSNWVNVKNKHISYIHTPPRFLYEEFNEMKWLRWPIFLHLISPYFKYLRNINQKKINQIDVLVANSKNVQQRIKKYYDRESSIIYPPVNTPKFYEQRPKRTHYLFFSRLVKQKGIELIINTFKQNKKPLLVVGTSTQEKRWHKMANSSPNIQFLGFVSDKKMKNIYRNCKALVYAAIEEDFGIAPVEAMGHGLPVIAYKSGGVQETVLNGKTGIFFNQHTVAALNKTIKIFEQMRLSSKICHAQAQKFKQEKFRIQFTKLIKTLTK